MEHGLLIDFVNLDEMQIVLDPTQKRVAVICGTKRIKQNHWHLEFTNCNG